VPDNFDREVVDEIVTVEERDALRTTVRLARSEGILAGISSGANLAAVTQLGERKEFEGKTVVTILCDTGERYLSTPLADEAIRGK